MITVDKEKSKLVRFSRTWNPGSLSFNITSFIYLLLLLMAIVSKGYCVSFLSLNLYLYSICWLVYMYLVSCKQWFPYSQYSLWNDKKANLGALKPVLSDTVDSHVQITVTDITGARLYGLVRTTRRHSLDPLHVGLLSTAASVAANRNCRLVATQR